MLTVRTNVLLDEERHNLLVDAARREGTSIGEIIRQAIDEKLKRKNEEIIKQQTEAVNKILKLRKKIRPLKGVTARELIDYGRYTGKKLFG